MLFEAFLVVAQEKSSRHVKITIKSFLMDSYLTLPIVHCTLAVGQSGLRFEFVEHVFFGVFDVVYHFKLGSLAVAVLNGCKNPLVLFN